MDILLGILLAFVGFGLCFMGLRVFFFALPIIGFIAGFYVALAGVSALFGDGFFATTTGILAGIIVGIIFSALSYLYWYVGALLAAGSTGALIGSALMHAFGVTNGWIVFIVAAIGAVILFLFAMAIALPVWVVIVNTAFIGAGAIITGILLLFGQIDRYELNYGAAWAVISESWYWMLAWILLAAFGMAAQTRLMEMVTLPSNRYGPAQPTTN
jgi:hypothetical protein